MINPTNKLKTYAFDIWVMKGTSNAFPAGTCTAEFTEFPTTHEVLEYIYNNFDTFCSNGRNIEIAKFYNINMHCIKFYMGSDTSATYYMINNIHEI